MVDQQMDSGSQDGFGLGQADGIVKEFLDPGLDFVEQLARAGLPLEDAIDYAEIWRTAITFRRPEMVFHSMHVLVASMGADRQARTEALAALTGHRQMMMNQAHNNAQRRGWLPFRGKPTGDSPQKMDEVG